MLEQYMVTNILDLLASKQAKFSEILPGRIIVLGKGRNKK